MATGYVNSWGLELDPRQTAAILDRAGIPKDDLLQALLAELWRARRGGDAAAIERAAGALGVDLLDWGRDLGEWTDRILRAGRALVESAEDDGVLDALLGDRLHGLIDAAAARAADVYAGLARDRRQMWINLIARTMRPMLAELRAAWERLPGVIPKDPVGKFSYEHIREFYRSGRRCLIRLEPLPAHIQAVHEKEAAVFDHLADLEFEEKDALVELTFTLWDGGEFEPPSIIALADAAQMGINGLSARERLGAVVERILDRGRVVLDEARADGARRSELRHIRARIDELANCAAAAYARFGNLRRQCYLNSPNDDQGLKLPALHPLVCSLIEHSDERMRPVLEAIEPLAPPLDRLHMCLLAVSELECIAL
ncbi:MAG TPA: hypothetical protein VH877_23995 [Polyangia bacterium]|nr:hypothetical protein [Polyangia bacterium]